jgi:hypothetical protein
VFRSSLRRQLLSPSRMRGLPICLPQFVRLFARLMEDRRSHYLPSLELDFIPVIGQLDWLLVAYPLLQLFIWLCPPREHVSGIAGGGI